MKIDLKDVKKDGKEKRTVSIHVRTYPSFAKWMTENEVSPSKLFNVALEQVMPQEVYKIRVKESIA